MKHLQFIFFFLITITSIAQEKAVVEVADSVVTENEVLITNNDVEIKKIDSYAERFVPRKASLYAAILPGMGQIYNKKYWKLPIVYGGFVALSLTVNFYGKQHKIARTDLFAVIKSDTDDITLGPETGLDVTQLRTAVDDTRRERDYFIILTGVFYLLQIADAHIDAHLKEFQLNPDLKVSIDPMVEQQQSQFANNYNAGLSLKLHF